MVPKIMNIRAEIQEREGLVMAKTFDLDLGVHDKKIPSISKVKSIYNIDYTQLDMDETNIEKLIKYEMIWNFTKKKRWNTCLNFLKPYMKQMKFLLIMVMEILVDGLSVWK